MPAKKTITTNQLHRLRTLLVAADEAQREVDRFAKEIGRIVGEKDPWAGFVGDALTSDRGSTSARVDRLLKKLRLTVAP